MAQGNPSYNTHKLNLRTSIVESDAHKHPITLNYGDSWSTDTHMYW